MKKIEDLFTAEELEKMDDAMKSCVAEQVKKGKSKEEAMKACEVKAKKVDEAEVTKADDKAEEPKEDEKSEEVVEAKEEVVEDKAEETEEEVVEEKEDEKVEEEVEEVQKELDPISVLKSISEMENPEEIKGAIQAALDQLVKKDENGVAKQASNVAVDVTKMFQDLMKKLDYVADSFVKSDNKPEEPEVTEADKGEVKEEGTKEEVSTEVEAKPEVKPSDETPAEVQVNNGEEVAKMESSILVKVDEKLSPVLKSIEDLVASVKKLSEQPVPGKVASAAVVEKSFEVSETNEKRINEINEELQKISEVRDSNPAKYQRENLADKAFKLISEKDSLKLGL